VVAVALAGAAALRTYARGRRGQPRTRLQELGLAVMQAVPDGIGALPAAARRPGLLLGALAFWVGDCGVLVVAFHAAGGSASVGVVVLAYMLGQLGNTLPLPGGVGGVEPIMLGVMTASGIGLGLGGAAVVLYRLVSLGLQAIFGALAVTALVPALRRRAPVPTPAPVEA
jgi:uncharacterized membrane protein YbhN (UPF0104 family)